MSSSPLDWSHIEPVDPFALEGAGWLSAGEAKTQLLEACEGDKELAQQIWGDKGSAEMHEDSLATLIKQAVEVLDSKRQHQNETDDEVVAEEVEMF